LLTQEQYEIKITPSDDYKQLLSEADFMNRHKENITQSYVEIDMQQMNDLRNNPSTLIIDVREPHEFPQLDSDIYKRVPMAEFETFASSLIVQQNIVLICQHGIRSVAAAEILHEKFGETKNIYSLKGGISKWRQYFLTTQHER
ncbi:MAG: rhodanese-like domain-containing protein, partial [Sphingobacteriales bacterium]